MPKIQFRNRGLETLMHAQPATAYSAKTLGREPRASSHVLEVVAAGQKPPVQQLGYVFIGDGARRCLLGASPRGICFLEFVDGDDGESLAALHRAFPRAEVTPVEGQAAPGAGLLQFMRETPVLHLLGTPFQLRVWSALLRLPSGSTISYQALAGQIGEPRSARAVAGAVAANRVAVLVPCHRVVRSDGGLGGYRWGAARKAQILAEEQAGLGAGRSAQHG